MNVKKLKNETRQPGKSESENELSHDHDENNCGDHNMNTFDIGRFRTNLHCSSTLRRAGTSILANGQELTLTYEVSC